MTEVEQVPLDQLHAHPRNYRTHPEDQLSHLVESIKINGVYKNVVATRDGTLLAGHGVVEAARLAGLSSVPVIRLDIDPHSTAALKILAGDNEISHLGEVDDRALSELLREVMETDVVGLLATGYDAAMLTNLAFVTRPESEIKDLDVAAAWAGLPEYKMEHEPLQIIVTCETEEDREAFLVLINSPAHYKRVTGSVWSVKWPSRPQDDLSSVKFKQDG